MAFTETSINKQGNAKIKARALEVVYEGHLIGRQLLESLRKKKYGVYKAFVKWHNGENGDEPHTHLAVILREKPEKLTIKDQAHKTYFSFQVGDVGDVKVPTLVKPLGSGNTSPLKKLGVYVSYLVDGHDNGTFKDTWNYKYDYELDRCKNDGRLLCLLSRGLTLDEILGAADWNFRAYYFKNKSLLDKMIDNQKRHNRDDTVRFDISSFKQEATALFKDWDPAKQTLILRGHSGAGKTEIAKAVLLDKTGINPKCMSDINALNYVRAHQPIIFDDMNFGDLKRNKAIHLMDIANDRDIRILYGIHTIEAGTPRIMCTNEELDDILPLKGLTEKLKIGILRRVYEVDLHAFKKLYK